MSDAQRIRWTWIIVGGLLAEITVIAIFFLLLFAAMAAGVPEIAQPMTTLDYIDAMVMSFVSMLVFTIWVGKRIDSAFVLHGVLIALCGILLFTVMWIGTTGSLAQPALYVVARPEDRRGRRRRSDRRKATPARSRSLSAPRGYSIVR